MNEEEKFIEQHPGLKKYFLTGKYGDKHSSILLPKVRQIIHETQTDNIKLLEVLEKHIDCDYDDHYEGEGHSNHCSKCNLKKELKLK